VDIRIKRVLSGVKPPRTLTIVHQPERQRNRDGGYVVPFFREPRDEDLVPEGWIPRDYQDCLREIQYDPRAVAWMGERRNAEPGWARIEGLHQVANRGLVLDDLESLLAQMLAAPCKRDAP
jgi:hypothetical protein